MRSVRISDLVDDFPAPAVDIHETRAVSPERIKEIAMERIHSEKRSKLRLMKRPAVVILAAALSLALGTAAMAAAAGIIKFEHKGTDADFYDGAFGTGVAGQEAHTNQITDRDGNVLVVEHYPAVERVEADPEQAAELVGAHLLHLDEGVAVGDMNLILRSLVLDANNIGVLTYEIQKPDGLDSDRKAGWFTLETASGRPVDVRDYLLSQSDDGTSATYVCYFTPFEACSGEALLLTWHVNNGLSVEEYPMDFSFADAAPLPARTFAAEGLTASVSPLGMMLRFDMGNETPDPAADAAAPESAVAPALDLFGGLPVPTPEPSRRHEKIERDLVIRYADGEEYIIKGPDLINLSVSSVSRDFNTEWVAFNRLADVDAIAEIYIAGHWHDDDDLFHAFDLTLTAAE